MRSKFFRHHDVALASARVEPFLIDESGSTTPIATTIGDVEDGRFSVAVRPIGSNTSSTSSGLTAAKVIGSIYDDIFAVDQAAIAAATSIVVDGEAGRDRLDLHFVGDTILRVDRNGEGQLGSLSFTRIESLGVTLAGGRNVIATGAGDDTITAVGGVNALTTGAGADRITVTGDATSRIRAGAGDDVITAQGKATAVQETIR